MSVDPSSRGWNEHKHLLEQWTDFIPTLAQGVGVTFTGFARYIRRGQLVVLVLHLTSTSAGTSGAQIILSLPSIVPGPRDVVTMGRGTFIYTRAGTGFYVGAAYFLSATQVAFLVHNANNVLGAATPAFAVAAGDELGATVTYETAAT